MSQKVDISHVPKFNGTYFNIWKHRLTLIFKTEKLWSIVSGVEPLPVAPTAAEITAGSQPLPQTGTGSISHWEERDSLSLTIINNCLENNVVSHIQSCTNANQAWQELTRIFESQDTVTKMHLKDKLHTLKMKESDNVTKHVHLFRSHLENLAAAGCPVGDEEAILALMRSLPPSYRIFISSLRRQPGITLQSLITDLIQEETLMKDMNWNNENQSALYTKRKFYNNSKKPYLNRNFHKGENSKPLERKYDSSNKRNCCFYCKKPGHLIQKCRI